jgi:uncharacterized membrane protein
VRSGDGHVRRSVVRRIVLWVKIAVSTGEAVAGLVLFVAGVLHADLTGTIRRVALHELHEDPGDYIARHVMASAPSLSAAGAVILGLVLLAYAAVKAGVLLAVLQERRLAALCGAVLFAVIAGAGAVVLVLHPTVVRGALWGLDVFVAAAVVLEVRAMLHAERDLRSGSGRDDGPVEI